MNDEQIDPKIYDLYDEFCHSSMSRRDFFNRAATVTVAGGLTGVAMASMLLPNYAVAQDISDKDERIIGEDVAFESPGGNAGKLKGYLVRPKGSGPFPAVIVVHENRGLNPYIRDVARSLAVAGYVAFAPDALSAVGGYPGEDEKGKVMQAALDQDKILVDMKNSAYFLKKHSLSNGKLGAVGFCFGGFVTNYLAVELGADLLVGVPFYGRSPRPEDVKKIKASMLVHYAETDEKVNATREEYELALKNNKIKYELFTYKATNHGFHNSSNPRYDKGAAKLAWERTLSAFEKKLK